MASQNEQHKNLDSMIQATTSFYNALWDYWGVMIHEEDNLQLKDGTFKGLDRIVRAYLSSLRKSQMKRAQDGFARDSDWMDPRDRLIQSHRETIERQDRNMKRACDIIDRLLSKESSKEDVNLHSNTTTKSDQSRRESDKLEEPREGIDNILNNIKFKLQLNEMIRLLSVGRTGNSTIEQVEALMTQPTKEELEQAIRRRENSEFNSDNSASFTPDDYFQEANKRMDYRPWSESMWLTRPTNPLRGLDGDSEVSCFSNNDESTHKALSPASQDNLDLRKMCEPKELNTQIPNFLNQFQEKEDGECDTTGSASSMNQELSHLMQWDSSSGNSVHSSSWVDEDDWGHQEIQSTQREVPYDENLTEDEGSLEDDGDLGLKKMYETQEDENLAENENTECSQASTQTQHLLSDSVI
ncbi:hypothetical protein N7528_000685 [Penicillium herquei]|nr:hypothetical protein N7528_000685 [Penicillium herquei]